MTPRSKSKVRDQRGMTVIYLAHEEIRGFSDPERESYDRYRLRLPPGSIVQFREPTFWEQYRWYIIAALAIITLQTSIITDLLLHRARRGRARPRCADPRPRRAAGPAADPLHD